LWSPIAQAGIKNYKFIDWFREHTVADDLKLLRWSDKKLDGQGYVDWYEFDHPQLGNVELGGWNWLSTWTNPPAKFLENEIKPFPKWLVWHALISPKLNLREAEVSALGKDTYRLRIVLENTGWLPSNVTQKALERKVRGLVCEIELPKGAKLESGKLREELGQLEGRAYKEAMLGGEGTGDRLKVEWIVHAPKGGKVKVIARHERAGTIKTELELK
jgi:murein tripeptide amidase MpaA